MPPPSGLLKAPYGRQFPGLPAHPAYSASPKRLSLDERLEREHGIKLEEQPPMDFSRPPPGFPGGPPGHAPYGAALAGMAAHGHLGAAMSGGLARGNGGGHHLGGHGGQGGGHGGPERRERREGEFPQHSSGGVLRAVQPHGASTLPSPTPGTTLPTTIPTYDDTRPAANPQALGEKEAATLAAQAVASKLQEMQAAKEEERRRKKEQKMADRLAAQLSEVAAEVQEAEQEVVRTATGRILDMVERQEDRAARGEGEPREDARERLPADGEVKGKRKRKEKDAPLLITLKPFYRPNERNGRKRKVEPVEVEEEEDFVPRSPVPLPDSAGLRPVLVKPYLARYLLDTDKIVELFLLLFFVVARTNPLYRMKLPGYGSTPVKKSKGVKYADGVLPGQGSPDQNPPVVGSAVSGSGEQSRARRKRYKRVTITVITQHTGDTDSEGETPPPPPPGSPTRSVWQSVFYSLEMM